MHRIAHLRGVLLATTSHHIITVLHAADIVGLLVGEAQFRVWMWLRLLIIVEDISFCNSLLLVVLCCGARASLMRVMQQVLATLLIARLHSCLDNLLVLQMVITCVQGARKDLGSVGMLLWQVRFHDSTAPPAIELRILQLNRRLAHVVLHLDSIGCIGGRRGLFLLGINLVTAALIVAI